MTILELAATNWNVAEIEARIRETPHGKLIRTVRAGSSAREYFGDAGFEVEIFTKSINHYESSDGWGLIEKNLPKGLAELEVDSWQATTGPMIKSRHGVKLYIECHDGRPMFN